MEAPLAPSSLTAKPIHQHPHAQHSGIEPLYIGEKHVLCHSERRGCLTHVLPSPRQEPRVLHSQNEDNKKVRCYQRVSGAAQGCGRPSQDLQKGAGSWCRHLIADVPWERGGCWQQSSLCTFLPGAPCSCSESCWKHFQRSCFLTKNSVSAK